jgi:putative ABC transport system permease protein
MRAWDVAALGVESLTLHRLRTGLSVLAVAIGACAVLLLTGLGEAAKRYVVDQFAAMGTNLVMVAPGRTETAGVSAAIGSATRDLTLEDAETVARRAPAVRAVAPVALGSGAIERGDLSRDVYVVGTTSVYGEIRGLAVSTGMFLPSSDARRGEHVAVIGSKLKRELFGDADAVGEDVRISRARFRVIGVLAPKGQAMGIDLDEMVLIPARSGLQLFNQSCLHRLVVQARDAGSIAAALEQTRAILTDRHRDEDFTLITQDAMLRSFRAIIDALTYALAGIAGISLAVAAIGIMNVMLVSVSERVPEIGLLKALGARRRAVAALFFTEAVMISAAGALLGIALGLLGARLAQVLWPALPIRPGAGWMALVFALALAVGAGFGAAPANRAASLPAAEALRGRR